MDISHCQVCGQPRTPHKYHECAQPDNTIDGELRNALEHIWGGGVDYALSPDFKDLTVDEKDALYIRYRDNLIDRATHTIKNKIAQEANKAYQTGYNTGWQKANRKHKRVWRQINDLKSTIDGIGEEQ